MVSLRRRIAASISSVLVLAMPVSGQAKPEPIEEALAFVPDATDFVGFSDWGAMKAARGLDALDALDGTLPADERLPAMLQLIRDEAPFAGFGLDLLTGHAEIWGWDTTDVAWEAMIVGEGAPVHVLRFRDDLDLGPFAARLDERGFSSTTSGAILIRSHEQDPAADWFATTDLGIGNIAFLEDGRTIVLSSQLDSLARALAAWRRVDARGGLEGRARQLGTALVGVNSAAIDLFAASCRGHDPRSRAGAPEEVTRVVAEVLPLRSWRVLGLGIYPGGDGPGTARLVLGFSSSDAATLAAELEARERLAEAAMSGDDTRPYELVGSGLDDGLVRLDLAPLADGLGSFRRLLFEGGLAPAMCG